MGFRCPGCRKDFGNDQAAFKDHLRECPFGRELVAMVLTTTDNHALLHQLTAEESAGGDPVPD